VTILELFNECWADHWDQSRFHDSGHAKEVKSKFKLHIEKTFGDKEYLSVTRAQVRDWHKSLRETPTVGNRCMEILSKLYRFSIDKEWNSGAYNPCFGIKHFTEKKRRRFASENEIGRIGVILNRELSKKPLEITFILTLFFTGARPRSLERARWDEFTELDGGFGLLTFFGKSTAETGDEESLILPPNIVTMMKVLPKRDDGFIFGIKAPSYLWRKIRAEAGCRDLWLRDSRRSFATVGMGSGVKMDTIGKLLNHHSNQTTMRYALLNRAASVEAVTVISDKLKYILKK